MTKKIWKSERVSIIVLPSGKQGREILDLAQAWSRSWLLTPALWLLSDEIPEFDASKDLDLQVPPSLSAYLLGRDSDQNPVREKVDVFWTLGSQPFKIIRFVAVRTEQDPKDMERTTSGAESAAKFIERAVPKATDLSREDKTGALFKKFNLVIAPTNERRLLQGVLSRYWHANLVAAAEDRATPLSTDSFVKVGDKFTGFALAHIATTAGLWAGLPVSSAEIKSDDKNQLGQARLQRVFVRGVTNDALSADVAHWALQKLNYTDSNFEVGLIDGRDVTTIAAEVEETKMNELAEYILQGPEGGTENFLYPEYKDSPFLPHRLSLFKKLVARIQDMAEGLASIPKWLKASTEYRLQIAIDDFVDEDILYDAVPKRLAPRVKLPPVDVLVASLKPKLAMPSPALWKHMRESISAAIDAPSIQHPEVLKDVKGDKLLVFSTIDRVLPNPETSWSGESYSLGTTVKFENIGWLDASKAFQTKSNINNRITELAPGIEDARSQLSETQKLVDDAEHEYRVVNEDLGLIEKELKDDLADAERVNKEHSHDLPKGVTGPARKMGQKGRRVVKSTEPKNNLVKPPTLESVHSTKEENNSTKPNRFRRFFSSKGQG